MKSKIKILEKMKEVHLEIGKKILVSNRDIYYFDIYTFTVLNRSLQNIYAFMELIENKRFMVAASIVRLQLDTLLRYYAAWLVDDPEEFAHKIIKKDNVVRKYTDKNKKKLTDNYLCETLSKDYPWVRNVYKQTSGYIHLSMSHYANIINPNTITSSTMQLHISPEDQGIPTSIYEEAVEAMISITKILFRYAAGWIERKNMYPEKT